MCLCSILFMLFLHEKINELILWQVDFVRVDLMAIDLMRIDHVKGSHMKKCMADLTLY